MGANEESKTLLVPATYGKHDGRVQWEIIGGFLYLGNRLSISIPLCSGSAIRKGAWGDGVATGISAGTAVITASTVDGMFTVSFALKVSETNTSSDGVDGGSPDDDTKIVIPSPIVLP